MIRAVIFDVDGTLIDSVDLHARAWQDALSEFGKTISFEDVRFQIGKGGDQLLPVFLSPEEIASSSKEIEKRRGEIFKEKYLPLVKSFPLVRELFMRVLADGKRIALASSAKGEELQAYKALANIDDLIETETSKDDAEKSKPFPDIFEAAIKRLGDVTTEQAIVIGDTPYDIEAAGRIGIRTIAVLCGGFPAETLGDAIAIYQNPADLLARYDLSPLA
ncbi:MAG: family hydrolase [Chthoniobacteraceae bacterium]|nr:family hydrolase [Chthoniobacteraceae bacterium]